MKHLKKALKTFFKSEISIGISLLAVTIVSLIIVNSDGHDIYQDFFNILIPLNVDILHIHKDLTIREWINDGLMAIFFLLVGLELKREVIVGELSSKRKVALPAIAAIGGVIFPIIIFYSFNILEPQNLKGFAVPTATDIAFAYGIISLFGKKISTPLKVFLVALAVLDDLAAILMIAVFYSQNLKVIYLIYSLIVITGLLFLNLKKSDKISYYLILGFLLWMMILKSGIHATLAGVITALFIPLQVRNKEILYEFAHKITPAVNFLILPLFAFANAGVRIEEISIDLFKQPLVLGIICGLFFGKQIGVMLFAFITTRLNLANLPRGANWIEFYGVSIFTGIGFTMSLFIGSLAFVGQDALYDQVKIGVLAGSLLSMLYGMLVIYIGTRRVFNPQGFSK